MLLLLLSLAAVSHLSGVSGQNPTVCTVTGYTVINNAGTATTVPDRCAYTLLDQAGIKVVAVFKDRHIKDVAFLDHLKVTKDGGTILMGQGGSVQVGGQELILEDPEVHHGLGIEKSSSGIVISDPSDALSTTIFFDGYTAQISSIGQASQTSLCGGYTDVIDVKDTESSDDQCDSVQPVSENSECDAVRERCGALKNAPYSDECQMDAEPYITACSNTLCRYEEVDGLDCQFKKAFARACFIVESVAMASTLIQDGCTGNAFCQDHTCAGHEFCGNDNSGSTNCFCQATYASDYSTTLVQQTVCSTDSASVKVAECFLKEKGIDYNDLHLNDDTCDGTLGDDNMVTFSFDKTTTCNAVATVGSDGELIFTNTITILDTAGDTITRNDQVDIDFSCSYAMEQTQPMSFNIRDSSVTETIVSGDWTYTLTMTAYTDSSLQTVLTSETEVNLGQTIWMELETAGLDNFQVAMVIDSCWATNTDSPTTPTTYNLITGGCADDSTVVLSGNGQGTTSSFSFEMFEFTGSVKDVYLHCEVKLCKAGDSNCLPSQDCMPGARRRRSARSKYADENPAFISMAWTS